MMLAVADALFLLSRTALFIYQVYYRTQSIEQLKVTFVIYGFVMISEAAISWSTVVILGERYVQLYTGNNCLRYPHISLCRGTFLP